MRNHGNYYSVPALPMSALYISGSIEGGGGTGGPNPSSGKSQKYRFLSNSGPNPEKHKATNSGFKVGPSLARQRNAI